ncbi:TLC domain-containing protein [Geranomyces variabilis]|nr:TLC domain-containing protein [Geranomyces variabilis]KAJ3143006.1 TLC domain-containing protein 1 [Geranomyces variabilis]
MAVEEYQPDEFCTVLGYQSLIASFLSFVVLRFALLKPVLYRQRRVALDSTRRALLANHIASYLHALASSAAVIGLFVNHPSLLSDMQGVRSGDAAVEAARRALAFSTGYFFADCFDMLVSGTYRTNLGIWGHHIAAIACYTSSLHTCLLYPYLVFTLVVEINSIFLHHRKILALYYPDNRPVPAVLEQTNELASHLLLWTFPLTRILANLYVTYHVFAERKVWQAPAWTWWVAISGMAAVDWYNVGLWKQVKRSIAKDRLRRAASKAGASAEAEKKKDDDWVSKAGTELMD